MKPQTDVLFSSDVWLRALEKYAGDTHLSVLLFDADERVVFGPVNSTPLFKLFDDKRYDPGIFVECARLCLAQTDNRPAVIVSEVYGLAAVGTSLMLEGEVVGAAIAGYAFTDFSQVSEIQRLAKDAGIRFEQLWEVAREQKPVPKHRLMLSGELLQVLGDALLRENYRTRQYQQALLALEEIAREREQAYKELQETSSAMREQEERLRKVEKMAAAGQLAASMAHEINNPLSSVVNSLYLLETQSKLDESARLYVNTAVKELDRVSRIVKQSLSYYRVGTTPHDLDLGQIVNESLQIFVERFRRAHVDVHEKISTRSALVGFPDELRQVIDNLLLNALESMPTGGRLSISVQQSFEWTHNNRNHRKGVRLTIADTGCGIPKEHLWRIYEPFFTTKAEKGTGLGLWVLQGIVAKHEGVMSLRTSDATGRSGTVASVFFPSQVRRSSSAKPAKSESVA